MDTSWFGVSMLNADPAFGMPLTTKPLFKR
jgi:hypothetical protein